MKISFFRSGFLVTIICLCFGGGLWGCVDSQQVKKTLKNDRIYEESSSAARAAFAQNRIKEAINFYTLALKRARAIDQSEAIGNAAYNLAACVLHIKQYDRAQTLLEEANHEFYQSNSSLPDVLLLQARTAYLVGNTQAANSFIYQIKTNPKLKTTADHMAQASILEGQMACDRNDWSSATELLSKAQGYSELNDDSFLQAQLASLTGRIDLGINDLNAAVNAFERQADLLRRSGKYRSLSSALAQIGHVHSALNEHSLAADYLYRAARIAAAWGDTTFAKEWTNEALIAANKAGDSIIARLAESLLSEITNDR